MCSCCIIPSFNIFVSSTCSLETNMDYFLFPPFKFKRCHKGHSILFSELFAISKLTKSVFISYHRDRSVLPVPVALTSLSGWFRPLNCEPGKQKPRQQITLLKFLSSGCLNTASGKETKTSCILNTIQECRAHCLRQILITSHFPSKWYLL